MNRRDSLAMLLMARSHPEMCFACSLFVLQLSGY